MPCSYLSTEKALSGRTEDIKTAQYIVATNKIQDFYLLLNGICDVVEVVWRKVQERLNFQTRHLLQNESIIYRKKSTFIHHNTYCLL